MEAIVFYPATAQELALIKSFASQNELVAFSVDEDSKRKLAAMELSKLAANNPKAYATDEEIISAVEEVREERYGKRN